MLLAVSIATAALLLCRDSAARCTANLRRSWTDLSNAEKKAYIQAELCLINSPPKNGLGDARSIFEELQWTHLEQTDSIHGVPMFLPWHRQFVKTHEAYLQTECNYQGAQPYWDEMADSSWLEDSEIFEWFGGDGSGQGGCLTDGPFANLELRLNSDDTTRPYCLSRDLRQDRFVGASASYVNECYEMDHFDDAWPCYEGYPHTAGHNGIGGVMAHVAIAPGDPIFYLHHTYLDKLYWEWQQEHPDALTALTWSGGRTAKSDANGSPPLRKSALIMDDGDNGTATMASQVLWMAGMVPNVTISEVLDITGDVICAEYV